ncbi:hypothetical protein B8A33_01170 [Dolosigranulum pigrum]|uniref:CinA family nicotinamide mononucleotide deamidase-related protein n=1 Tax=Dolosigranulum pigrum TaxID=29394 RepID=UPI000DBFE6CA|nr:CinA family nicotinamide mononucleotide deamidase-related protein [Dolosigranulum pigrum]RAN57874.1 hypothetical protein B8A33_01170 [Dolosigranulum pigrum]
MKAEIIAIGTELLLGQVTNSNAAYIARELAASGIDCYFHTVVGDNPERLRQAIAIATSRADLLIFSGGLGPTKDDITKEIIADYLDVPLVDDAESQAHIRTYYERKGQPMPESNKRQSQILQGATLLPNENGMAPGSLLEHDGTYYAMVPGVPREMEAMVTNQLIPSLLQVTTDHECLESKILRFFHITESQMAKEIDDIIEQQTNPTVAIYVDGYEVTVRLSAKASSTDKARDLIHETEAAIMEQVGDYFYASGSQGMVATAVRLLEKAGQSISIAEYGLGGVVTSSLFNHLIDKSQLTTAIIESVIDNEVDKARACSIAQQFKINSQSDMSLACVATSPDASKGGFPPKIYVGLVDENQHFSWEIDLSYRREVTAEIIQLHVANCLREALI